MQKEYKWRKRTNEDSSKTSKQETTILQRYDSNDQQQSWSYFKPMIPKKKGVNSMSNMNCVPHKTGCKT